MKASQLKVIRLMLDITQSELAKATKLPQSAISKIENGQVKEWEKYSDKIMAALDVKRLWLIVQLEDQKKVLEDLF